MTRLTEAPSVAAPPAALREIDDLPGPRGLPFVGNLLQIDKRAHPPAGRGLGAAATGRSSGSSSARARLLVVADHAAIGAVCATGPTASAAPRSSTSIGREMGLPAGRLRRRGRGLAAAAPDGDGRLRPAPPARLLPVAGQGVAPARGALARRPRAAGAPIDLQADLMRFTVDAISGLAFGADVNTLESDDDVIQRHLDKIFPALFRRLLAPLPTWRWWKTRRDRELERSVAAVNRRSTASSRAARARLDADPARRAAPHNLLEAMIVAADDPRLGHHRRARSPAT